MEIMNRRKRINGHRRIKRTPIRSFDLHPAPDRVLSNAARDAKMANVPHDYSESFNEIAKGYEKYTKGIATGVTGIIGAIKGKTTEEE